MKNKLDKIRERIVNWLKNPYNLLLLGILFLAIAVRIYFFSKTLNQAVWWDEGEYLLRVKHLVLDTPQSGFFSGRELFIPYFWALIFKIFKSEIAIRFVQVIMSSLTVFATYYLGKEVYNKKTGILAALFMSTFWLHLFFTARLLTYLYAPLFYTLALAFFWKGYLSNSPRKNLYLFLAFSTITLGIGIYYSIAFAAITILLFLMVTEQHKFLFKKDLWKMGLLSLPFLALSFIPSYIIQGHVIPRLGQIGIIHETEVGAGLAGLFTYLTMMPRLLLPLYLFIAVASLFLVIRFLFYFDFIVKQKENILEFKKDFFIFLGAIVPLGIFTWLSITAGGAGGAQYDAWILPVFPALFCFSSRFLLFLGDNLSKYFKYKKAIFVIILIIVSIGAYGQLSFADDSIKGKLKSYYNLKPSGEWLKENTVKGDVIFSSSLPVTTYYSEREVISPHFKNSSELKNVINEKKPKYLLLTIWENTPEWVYNFPESGGVNMSVANVYFLDESKQQPDVIIYQIHY